MPISPLGLKSGLGLNPALLQSTETPCFLDFLGRAA